LPALRHQRAYTEPKKLVAHGLASATRTFTGRRPRTVYAITDRGREALQAWLDRPGSGPLQEFEALVQVAFADQGSREQLPRTLRSIREQAEVTTWPRVSAAEGAQVPAHAFSTGWPS
jgi:DNA-binding PadR family transcriptional regulator